MIPGEGSDSRVAVDVPRSTCRGRQSSLSYPNSEPSISLSIKIKTIVWFHFVIGY